MLKLLARVAKLNIINNTLFDILKKNSIQLVLILALHLSQNIRL